MFDFYKISIKNKIILIIVTVSFIGLLIGTTIMYFRAMKVLSEKLIHNSILHSKLIAEYVVTPLDFQDKNGALDIISKTGEIKELVLINLYDAQDNLFAEYGPHNQLPDPELLNQNSNVSTSKDFIQIYQPINYKGKFLGTVYTITTKEFFKKEMRNYLLQFSVVFILIILIMSLQNLKSYYSYHNYISDIYECCNSCPHKRRDQHGVAV